MSDMNKKVAEATKKVVEKKIDKDELQKKTLRALAIKEETAKKIAASIMVEKALREKQVDIPVNKNINLKIDANKDREKIGIFFKKGF
jgi:hypothetical protein